MDTLSPRNWLYLLTVRFGPNFPDQLFVQSSRFSRVKDRDLIFSQDWQDGLGNFSTALPRGQRVNPWRLAILTCLFLTLGFIFIFRLFGIQLVEGKRNFLLSEGNRIFIQAIPAERGVIYDRNGKILARNRGGFSVSLILSQVPEEKKGELKKELASLLDLGKEEIETKFKNAEESPFSPLILKSNLDHLTQIKVKSREEKLPGIRLEESFIRTYPEGSFFSPVLGFTGEISEEELEDPDFANLPLGSIVGKEGIEKVYEQSLRGKKGKKLIEVDASGKTSSVLAEEKPISGKNLVLSIDAELQKKVGEILGAAVEKYGATGGVALIQNVDNGQVLSLISLPTFENELFTSGVNKDDYQKLLEDPLKPLFNRAISGFYPPGSTVKPMIATAALEENLISATTRISDQPQVIRIGVWQFPDWTVSWGRPAHGILNVKEAIAQSCDIFFYKIGGGYEDVKGLGIDLIKKYYLLFGLGEKLGVDLSGEVAGLVPDPYWKEQVKNEPWFLGNTYHVSIGQGDLLVTPLQILSLATTLANNGRVLKPRLVEKIVDSKGNSLQEFSSQVLRENFISLENLEIVKEGMRLAVTDGIIFPLRTAKVSVAAKTGTAEFGTPNARGEFATHAWVMGFAPYEDPKISFVVLLESGGKSNNAAEVAREIVDYYFSE